MRLTRVDLLVLLFILVVTLARLMLLTRTPLFGDEGLYCYLGYQINHLPLRDSANLVLNVWKDAPLLPMINAVALRLLPSFVPLWTCRATVVLVSAIGAVGIFGIGGWAAGLFYLLNPFSIFLERTVSMEPVLNAMAVIYVVVSLRAMKNPTVVRLMGLGVATALVLAAKQTGLLILPIPFIIAWWQRQQFPNWSRVVGVVGGVAVGLMWLALSTTRLADTVAIHTTAIDWARIRLNLWLMLSWLIQYWSWWVVPLMLVGIWQAVKQKLWGWILVPGMLVGIFAGVGWRLFPRYLLVIVPFVALVSSLATRKFLGKLLFLVVMVVFVGRDVTILTQPEKAKLAKEDRYQFFEDWGSGLGTKAAIEFLESQKLKDTLVMVPQDITGLWTVYKLSLAPKLVMENYFYTSSAEMEELVSQSLTEGQKPWLVTTSHHGQMLNVLRDKYQTRLVFASNGEARNSVRIEEVLRQE